MAETVTRIYELQVKLAQESLAVMKKIKDSTNEIDKGFKRAEDAVKSFGKGLIAGLTVGALVSFVKSTIDATAALGDMAAATGTSVENLSKLQQVAVIAGVDMDTVAAALGHINVALHENEKGSRNMRAALSAIGLSFDELKTLDPSEAIKRIAVNLDKFADDGGKAAAMVVLLGDSSSRTASYVHNLATAGEQHAKVTAMQVEQAEAFNKQLHTMQAEAGGAGRAIVIDLLPSLTRLLEWFNEGVRVAGSFWELFLLRATNPMQALTMNVDQLTAKLKDLRIERDRAKTDGSEEVAKKKVAEIDKQIVATTKLIEIQKFRDKQIADAKAKAEFVGPPDPGPRNKPKLPFTIPERPKAAELTDFEKLTKALDGQRESLASVNLELPVYWKSVDLISELYDKLTPKQQEWARGWLAETKALEEGNVAAKKREEQLKAFNEELKKARTPVDEYFDSVKVLTDGLALAPERFLEVQVAIEALTEKLIESQKKTKAVESENDKLLKSIAEKVDGYAKSISDSLIDFVAHTKDAKFSFSDFVTSVLKDLAKMTTQMLLVEPLVASIKTTIEGMASTPASRLIKTLIAPTAAQSTGITPEMSAESARIFKQAKGGAFNSPSLARYSNGVYDTPQFFKFAQGGVFGEAGPEAVMPLSRGSDGSLGVDASGAGVTVNVYNESKAEVTTQTRTDINGRRVVELLVKDAVAAGFRSGAFDAVMGTTYGLSRQGAR